VAEAHLLQLQELFQPLQACRPLHTQGGVDAHCLAEEQETREDEITMHEELNYNNQFD
jgi:hypothetical protein